MKNKETLRTAMDRRLSFLDDLPSCRAALQYRIAQEEEPVMKKKVSVGFVFAMVLVLLSVAALATGLLLSPRVSASRAADQALEKNYGVTAEMQTFFERAEEELPDGGVQVTYTGIGSLKQALGTYTALVRDGKAEISWNYDGKDTSGGYDSEIWGLEQLKQMLTDSLQADTKASYLVRAGEIYAKYNHTAIEEESSEAAVDYFSQREGAKTAAMQARKLSEDEMIRIGREFIISSYSLDEEQISRLELYTNSFDGDGNTWYETVDGKPCFQVEYLLYMPYTTEQYDSGESRSRTEKDGFYNVYVNVENGTIEQYEYNSALAGQG